MGTTVWTTDNLDNVQVIKIYKYTSPSVDKPRHNINVQFTTGFNRLMGCPKKVAIGFNKDFTEIYVKKDPRGVCINGTNTTINKLYKVLGDGILGNYEGELVGDTFIGIKIE